MEFLVIFTQTYWFNAPREAAWRAVRLQVSHTGIADLLQRSIVFASNIDSGFYTVPLGEETLPIFDWQNSQI